MQRYRAAGGTIVGHVHDEVIALERARVAEGFLATLNKCLTDPVPWAPGLLLRSEGDIADRFGKG